MSDGLTNKQKRFIDEYFVDFNATKAAIRAGYSGKTAYSIGQENLKKPEIKAAISAKMDELAMGENEILAGLTEQARADVGVFFKIVEEWTYYPLPSYDVIDAREVEDTSCEPPKTRVSYWVRHVALDMEKLVDPKYSHLLKKFSDSPKNGLSVELHDKQNAYQIMAKLRGMSIEKVDLTTKGEKVTPSESYDRAISKLADALGEILPGTGTEPSGEVGSTE